MKNKILSFALAGLMVCSSASALGLHTQVNAENNSPFLTDWITYNTDHIEKTRSIAGLTGDKATTDTTRWGVGGTDLGIPFTYTYKDTQGNDKTELRFVFGDTFTRLLTGNWRSNVMAISTDTDYSDGITIDSFVSTASDGKATALIDCIHSPQQENTAIPTGAVQVGDAIYLYYMGIRVWGDPGDWWNNLGGVYKSTDGTHFTRVESMYIYANKMWSATQNYPKLIDEDRDGVIDYYYVYTLSQARASGLRCMRASLKDEQGNLLSGEEQQAVIENLDNYEYFNGYNASGEPTWIKYNEYYMAYEWNYSEKNEVIPAPCGEMSICWNPYLNKYMATYQQHNTLVMRLADKPYGPFSKAEIIVTSADFASLYNAFTTETMLVDNGKTVYFTMSQWIKDANGRNTDYLVRLMEMKLK